MFSILNSYMDNGLKIMLRPIPNQRTISCGLWINQGVKDEDSSNNGISHLIEHLMFKIKSKECSLSMDENLNVLKNIGAYYNATTTKDHTCLYIDGLSRDVNKILEILSYMVVNKEKVKECDLEKEKEIVLREAEGYLVSSRQIAERVGQALWGDNSFGQLVIGKPKNIKEFTCEKVDSLIEKAYIPENSVLVIVGGFDLDTVTYQINKYFSQWEDKYKENSECIIQSEPGIVIDNTFKGNRSTIGIGFSAYPCTDLRSKYVDIFKDILARPGSILFNEVREKRGLVYSLSGFATSFSLAGNMGIAFSSNNEDIQKIIEICMKELRNLINNGVDNDLLQNIKRSKETELLYAVESTSTQLKAIGKSAIRGQLFSLEDELREIQKINKEKMDQVIRDILVTSNLCMAVLGNVNMNTIIPMLEL